MGVPSDVFVPALPSPLDPPTSPHVDLSRLLKVTIVQVSPAASGRQPGRARNPGPCW